MAVEVDDERITMHEVHRFPNRGVQLGETLHWDVLRIYDGVLDGLRAAGPVASVGVDGWAVDYGLLDRTGALLSNPVHYRDRRTEGLPESVHRSISAVDLYSRTGLQVQPFNTIYQLAAAAQSPIMAEARQLLLIPDLLGFWLTGVANAEITNASTTGLLDLRSRSWAYDLVERVGVAAELLPPIIEPGEIVGPLKPQVVADTRQTPGVQLVAVGSHDTASAVAAVPARDHQFAYVATGTWSLVGVELRAPVLTEASRAANFTNELGVDGTVRYLRNVMGLWLLQECLREWGDPPLEPLLAAAAREVPLRHMVDAGDVALLAAGDMPARLAAVCDNTSQSPPASRSAMVRCILDSLALAHALAIAEASNLSGQAVETVHIVGGGARNALLCQLTADACGRPVVAGPVEAAALGNALIQIRTMRNGLDDLSDLRAQVAANSELVRYQPHGDQRQWAEAAARVVSSK